jgi:hypothetical protein
MCTKPFDCRVMARAASSVVLVVLAVVPMLAQSAATGAGRTADSRSIARTPWGDPDLQGTWDFTTITPLERPASFEGREFMTDAEALAIETQVNGQRVETEERSPGSLGAQGRPQTDPGIYNLGWWWEPEGRRLVRTRRTSLVVDPRDGRLPPLTPQARATMQAREAARTRAHEAADLPLAERCVMGFNSGPPMVPGPYNNLVQIFQSPGYVIIVNEMVHDARIVPLDGRPPVGDAIRFWSGDSRGRWDGATLVVETSNFTDHGTGTFGQPGLVDRHLHLVERFTRTSDGELMYGFTVNDPTVWTRPWSAEVPMRRIDGFVMEYACHEGNYGLVAILGGARAAERTVNQP